ncbi:hypothetical protein [Serratia marcescens]|uniref:hypothetical protein n=1 Tax=Serratia marcescens TaxID=615 RepID=UPI0007C92C06|nr:hypothetical protein [Serratia marcescens]OAH32795.1 hypothetical protein AYJ10_18850 [Serratia marcescens]
MLYKVFFGVTMALSIGNVCAEGIRSMNTLDDNFFNDKSIQANLKFKNATGKISTPKSCEDFYDKHNSSLSFENDTPSSNYSAVKSALIECIVNKEIGIKNIITDDTGIKGIKKDELPKYLPADFMLAISDDEKQSVKKVIHEATTLIDIDPSLIYLEETKGGFVYKDNKNTFYYIIPIGSWHKDGDKIYLFKLTNTLSEGTYNNTKLYYLKKEGSGFKTIKLIDP